ncbi:MAG: TetR/AcrR family transcriptional regulator [Solirubrobacterales bacterium]
MSTATREEDRRRSDARERMVRSAAVLFRSRGVEGTAFSEVIELSGAPRGSIYHHFPGGKDELAEAATRYAGDFIAVALAAALERGDPDAALGDFVSVLSGALRDSEWEAGCPVVAAALEGDRSPAARDAAGEAIGKWESLLAASFERNGVAAGRARSVATLAIASIEGAIVLARAQNSTAPIERVGGELERLAAEVLAEARA